MNKKEILRYQKSFKKRLAEAAIAGALEEVDMYDGRGNQVLTPDLKVKHKASGYEYTVDHVEGEDDDAVVFLRHPEAPRVPASDSEAPLTEKTTINVKDMRPQNMSANELGDMPELPDQLSLEKPSDTPEKEVVADPSLVSVPKAEFEKNYEVE